MAEESLQENTILFGEYNYIEATDLVLASAEKNLLIFDQDCSVGGFASTARYELIRQFLAKDSFTTLTIILHKADYFTQQCPQLFDLLAVYAHKMTVYITNDRAKVAKDCFMLADNSHYLRRIHIDHARFKYAFDDAETTNSLLMRFNELKDETSHTLSATKLGL